MATCQYLSITTGTLNSASIPMMPCLPCTPEKARNEDGQCNLAAGVLRGVGSQSSELGESDKNKHQIEER